MSTITLVGIISVWSIVCLLFYRYTRSTPWLAGSNVATCLFFLGSTIAVSPMVEDALTSLALLWISVFIFSITHVVCAVRRGRHVESTGGGRDGDDDAACNWDQIVTE